MYTVVTRPPACGNYWPLIQAVLVVAVPPRLTCYRTISATLVADRSPDFHVRSVVRFPTTPIHFGCPPGHRLPGDTLVHRLTTPATALECDDSFHHCLLIMIPNERLHGIRGDRPSNRFTVN